MANEILTTLHPDQDLDTNLYPNIKKENIPNKSIDTNKLDDNVLSLIGSLKPSGVDTSTNILAFTTDKGIYVGSDTGHWYYWNGIQYVDGGEYQALQLNDYNINEISKVKDVVNSINYYSTNMLSGKYYDGSGNFVDNENSVYLPEIDLTNYMGGTIKIIYRIQNTSSVRNVVFTDYGNSVVYYYEEKNYPSTLINDNYVLEIPILYRYSKMYFSISSKAQIISVSINKPIVTSNDVLNIIDDKKVLINNNIFYPKAQSNRYRLIIPNYIVGFKQINVENIPDGFKTTIFYRLNSSEIQWSHDTGWNTNSNVNYDVSMCYDFALTFGKIDNSNFTSDDVELIKNTVNIYNTISISNEVKGNLTLYVSPTGTDTNTGTSSNPLATINKALELGANTIMLLNGEYNQQIDLSKAQSSYIKIAKAIANGKVLFKDLSGLIGTSAELETGYTKVYKIATNLVFSSNLIWLFQENVVDVTTLISDSDRLPEQRGYEYRCSDTKIEKCTSTILSDALIEIENATKYKWFYDNGFVYFSSPQTIDNSHPLITSIGNSLFIGNSSKISIDILGIDNKYYCFNLTSLVNVNATDCSSFNVFGRGAFTYDNTLNITFKRCEATRCFTGSNGDGFNGHSSNSGEIYAHQTTCQLINCWSHDNNDDGYSDHEKCEINIYGGLYEHNKKGGITPSYGSHCTCYNVISRNNYNGFFYTGTSIDGGKYGQMTCFNCYSYENGTSGFRIDGTGNTMTLIKCISKGNSKGYVNDNDVYSKLINCYSLNNNTIKQGNFTIENATLVE